MNSSPIELLKDLPDLIALPRYVPERPSYRKTALEQVRSPEELPPYMLLGQLDRRTFRSTEDEWAARWVGERSDTYVEARVDRSKRWLELSQTWRGLYGGTSYMPADGFGRAVQGLYMGFPALWDNEAKARLEEQYWLKYLRQDKESLSMAGVPDGGFKTICVPLPVYRLQDCWNCLVALAGGAEFQTPFMTRLDLRMGAVNYVTSKSPTWTAKPMELFLRTFDAVGLTPIEMPKLETAKDGSSAMTVRRWVYIAHVGVPFAGLFGMVDALASCGLIRERDGADRSTTADGIEFDAFIGGPSLDIGTEAVQWFDEPQSRRVYYLLSASADGQPNDAPKRLLREMQQSPQEARSLLEHALNMSAQQRAALEGLLK